MSKKQNTKKIDTDNVYSITGYFMDETGEKRKVIISIEAPSLKEARQRAISHFNLIVK